ncbi:bcl-2-related ovarian killer protein homolog A-like [Lytechinus variegatus]|uniref:bcl-2-related ovarian killer protein homolog A-like n=1 Tax=Lytechinus variegatus TaxID=7654 RepID=UPI001BB18116|nr:bcl-2-related ovarian killer protein homolog A-like [Lytechinus variegatus]
MDYLHADLLSNVREGLLDTCRHHIHCLSSHLKHSTNGLYHLGQRLNEKVSIRSRRLLYKPPTEDDVVNQAKVLCRDYAYAKLRKHKLISRDIYGKASMKRGAYQLQFLKQKTEKEAQSSQVKKGFHDSGIGPSDVSKELIKVATEFERCFPYLYEDIADQLQLNFQSSTNIQSVYNTVGADIFRKGITWARIIALYTLTGVLIVECVKQGHHSQANALVDTLQKFVRKRLARWIIDQGGWIGLVVHFRQKQSSITLLRVLSLAGLIFGLLLVFWFPR